MKSTPFKFQPGARAAFNYFPSIVTGSRFLIDDALIVVDIRKDRGQEARYYVQAERDSKIQGWFYESDLHA